MPSLALIRDNPILLLPKLAVAFGLEEAIVVQQVYYWLRINENKERNNALNNQPHYREGRWWTYNTYKEWQRDFPFWSVQKIGRVFRSAEGKRLLVSRQFDVGKYDRRKWYSVADEPLRRFPRPKHDHEPGY